jgi:hypothetical protein
MTLNIERCFEVGVRKYFPLEADRNLLMVQRLFATRPDFERENQVHLYAIESMLSDHFDLYIGDSS